MQLATGIAALLAGLLISKNKAGDIIDYPLVGYMAIGFGLVCFFVARKVRAVDV